MVRFGLMVVPLVMFLSGGIQIYLLSSKYRSGVLFELENGPAAKEMVELVGSRGVLDRVVDHLKLADRMNVDRETAIGILKGVTTAKVMPDTRLVEVEVTLTNKVDARDVAADIPVSLRQHFVDAVQQARAIKVHEMDHLIRDAADMAEEKATVLTQLKKVHDLKSVDADGDLKYQRASRASLLADAEVERLSHLRSACLTDGLNELVKLTIHSAPVISVSPIKSKGGDLGELALRCLVVGLLCALLLPYLMELAFPPTAVSSQT